MGVISHNMSENGQVIAEIIEFEWAFFVGVTGNLQGTNRDRGVFGVKMTRSVELHLIG